MLVLVVPAAAALMPGVTLAGLGRAGAALLAGAGSAYLFALPLWFRAGGRPGIGKNLEPSSLGVDQLTVFGLFVFLALGWWIASAGSRLADRGVGRPARWAAGLLLVAALVFLALRFPDVFLLTCVLLFLAAFFFFAEEKEDRLTLAFLAAAFFLVLFTQRFYIVDRMNTFFKLYLEAWILFAIGTAVLVFRGRDRRGVIDAWPWPAKAAAALLVLAALFTSVTGGRAAVSRHFAPYSGPSLDGLRYLQEQRPGEYRAVEWMRRNVAGTPVVLEAQGPSYQDFGRISMLTGLPTLLGWDYHVKQRGNPESEIETRKNVVRTIYSHTEAGRAIAYLKRYGVGYIYVGPVERKTYPAAGLSKFRTNPQQFPLVYENPEVQIYRVAGGPAQDVLVPVQETLPQTTASGTPADEPEEKPAVAAEASGEAPWAKLREPRGIAVDGRGRVWVADFGNSRLRVFDRDGGSLGGWGGRGSGEFGFRELCGLAIAGDALYVADTWNGRVRAYTVDGLLRASAAELYGPRGIAVAPNGRVWVADTGNHRIVSYGPLLDDPRIVGKKGGRPGEFASPIGIAVSPRGRDLRRRHGQPPDPGPAAGRLPRPRARVPGLGRERGARPRRRRRRNDLGHRSRHGLRRGARSGRRGEDADLRGRERAQVRKPDGARNRRERPYPLRRQLGLEHGLEDSTGGRGDSCRSAGQGGDALNDTAAAELAGSRRRISGRLAAALLLFAALAVASRFWALGDRPLHHDESIHAYQSWTLSRGGDWRYDPAYHGPFLYYLNALVYKIFGATDATARLAPAFFGVILIAFAFPLARWIGRKAAAAYAIFVLLTAHYLYFSRFIREDLYSLVFTLGTIVAFQRFLETDRARWLLGSAASFAFAGVTKENAYMTGVLFVAYGLWCLVRTAPSPAGPKPGAAVAAGWRWTIARIAPVVSAGLLFLVIWAAMYTAFGKYPGRLAGDPQGRQVLDGPARHRPHPGALVVLLPAARRSTTPRSSSRRSSRFGGATGAPIPCSGRSSSRFPSSPPMSLSTSGSPPSAGPRCSWRVGLSVVAFVVAGWVWKPPPVSELSPFLQFVAFWAVGSLAIYAWAREKVPWLTVHPLLPLTMLAAIGVARLWEERPRPYARAGLVAIAALLAVNAWGAYLAAFRYGAHDVEKVPGHAEMLAYVQTSEDLVRSLRAVDQAKGRVPAGQNLVTVAGEAAWPLTWYLRDMPTTWASRIEQASTPVIVADWDAEGALEKQLADKYDAQARADPRVVVPGVRKEAGKPTRPSFRDMLRALALPRDLEPDRVAGRDRLRPQGPRRQRHARAALRSPVQDTSARDYPNEAVELPAGRVFGGPGAGPGQLSEPRGVAADAQRQPLRRGLEEQPDRDFRRQRRVPADGRLAGRRRRPAQRAERRRRRAGRRDLRRRHLEPPRRALRAERGVARGVEGSGPRFLRSARGAFSRADPSTSPTRGTSGSSASIPRATSRSSWGGAGNGPGQFVEPVGLAADAGGRIYVADTGNHRIQVFEADGRFVRQFPVYGWKDFYTEPYLAVGPADGVFVTDSWKGRIAHYDAAGNLQKSFSAKGLKSPTGIALDAFGRVFVSDRGQNRIVSWGLADLMR